MTDIANKIIDGIVRDISDRRGLGDEWEMLDDDIREEITEEWRKIIDAALGGKP